MVAGSTAAHFRLVHFVVCLWLMWRSTIAFSLGHVNNWRRYSQTTKWTNQQRRRTTHDLRAYSLHLEVPTPEDMEDVGAILSIGTEAGDCLLLGGDLGAGKTCLSRGFVRARTAQPKLRVTSPTYLLSNTYEADDGQLLIHHMDLYRLSGNNDLEPLDIDHVLSQCVSLIEWPSRLGDLTPPNRLDVTFKIDDDDVQEDDLESKRRYLTLDAHGDKWEKRLQYLVDDGIVDDMIVDSVPSTKAES